MYILDYARWIVMALWCTVALVNYVPLQKLGSKSHQSLQSIFYYCLAISFLLHLPMILHPSASLPASSCTLWQMVFENKNSLWHFWKAFGQLEYVVVVCTFFISLSVLLNLDLFPYQVCQMLFHGLMYLVLWSIAISNCQWHLYLLDRTWRG